MPLKTPRTAFPSAIARLSSLIELSLRAPPKLFGCAVVTPLKLQHLELVDIGKKRHGCTH